MKVLVTGGAGFIGGHVIMALDAAGHQVRVADLVNRIDIAGPRLLPLFADFRPNAVIHLAAIHGPRAVDEDLSAAWRTNVYGTWAVLRAAALTGCQRIVFASSAAVYPRASWQMTESDAAPASVYGLHKYLGEAMVAYAGGTSLRLFNVFGRGQRLETGAIVPTLLSARESGAPVPLTSGGATERDFVRVEDVARAFVHALTADPVTVNVCTGQTLKMREVAERLRAPFTEAAAVDEAEVSVGSTNRLASWLGWTPTHEDTLKAMAVL